jgi:SAM-dependent methyltransferase/pimeloyl-ACP methyl ester carboxylesterase
MFIANDALDVSDIGSSRVSFSARDGTLIVAYLDEGPEADWNGRFVILTPKYGETKKNNLRLSYVLAANGFKVLRFDHTNHVGESDGEMNRFTLPGAVNDILDSLNYVENHFEPSELILISNSLSARCAYRAAVLDSRVSRLVCIVGVVNLQRTIKNIYQKDIIGKFCEGTEWGTIDILGFDIDSANFISELVDSNMHDLAGAEQDARQIQKPLLHLHAAKDIWVDYEEVSRVVSLAGGDLSMIDGAFHEVGENPEAARVVMERVTRFCQKGLSGENETLKVPSKKKLFEQNKKERNRLKQIYQIKETEDDFWNGYLGKFGTIEQAHVYIDYFEKMQSLLGTIQSRDVLLDAGCGNGFFGLCLLHSLESALGAKTDFPDQFFYYGIDLTHGGLKNAYVRQSKVKQDLLKRTFDVVTGAHFAYQRFDFDRISIESSGADVKGKLPFSDGSISKICFSLVVSYLKDPVALVREFRRVLKPGGVAVISSMKPECDMTVLYHEFITSDEESLSKADDAQQLLGAAGQIKLKEQSGVYGFFTEEELIEIVTTAGFLEYDVFRSLGNQANLIRVTK